MQNHHRARRSIHPVFFFLLFVIVVMVLTAAIFPLFARYLAKRRIQNSILTQLTPPDACTLSRMDYARQRLAEELKINPQVIQIYEPNHTRSVFVLMRLSARERERLYPTKLRFPITDQERNQSIAYIMDNQPQPNLGPIVRPDVLLDSHTAYDTKSGFTVTTTGYPETYDYCYRPGWQKPRTER